ncbi:MAG: biosynthetic-type acetolactate synthase large subunit [Candidatus Altiarchaeota archaeon]
MKGAEAMIRCLEEEKVKHMFGVTGGAIMEVYDVLFDNSKIRHIMVRHEQVAAHAAEAYGKITGKPGVCISTSGPGATNLVTGIADAYMDSAPMIALTGQVAVAAIGNDAFQESDIIGITMPITKHNFQITLPESIPTVFKSAFKIATTRRQGPVLIDLPKNIQQTHLDYKFKYPKDVDLPGYKETINGGHPKQLKSAANLLMEAERPVIIAGGGIKAAYATGELIKMAESLGIPVAVTLMGKGNIPEDHPLALGMVGMHGTKSANLMVSECDVLFAIGCRFSDRITANVEYFAPQATIIHADIDASEIGKNVAIDLPIVGDARLILKNLLQLTAKMKAKGKTEWSNKLKQFKKEYAPVWDYDDTPIKQQRVMKELNSLIDGKTIITTEVGQCQMFAAHYLTIKNPRHFITSGGLGTMGAGFPFAIGAKVARPDHKVVDVASEGSFLMTSQDLATCVNEDIPVVVLILENRYLGMVKQWQDLFYGKRRSHTYLGELPDFVKYAESFSAKGVRIERPGEIREALKKAMKSGETTVLDVMVDPEEHILPMVPATGRIDEMIEKHMLKL